MATVPGAPRALSVDDLPGCLALSEGAGWNQNAEDWRHMLEVGRGWGIDPGDSDAASPGPIATIVVLPYRGAGDSPADDATAADAFAWISMVLVSPGQRGRGHATRLLEHAIAWLRDERLTPVLDATPAGFPVYRRLGFVPTWGFRRYRRASVPAATAVAHETLGPTDAPTDSLEPIAPADWAEILRHDRIAFGADRGALLHALAQRLPRAARIVRRDGRCVGWMFGRDGREAVQIGPLWAEDDQAARRLLDDGLSDLTGPVYVDLADRHLALLPLLVARGFLLQRPFTRMVLGATDAPGDPARLVLMAGPELG